MLSCFVSLSDHLYIVFIYHVCYHDIPGISYY